MKDLTRIADRCRAELDALGIKYRTVRSFSVNNRAKSRFGLCKRVADGVFDISISASLLDDGVDDNAAAETVMHELLHTVEGCMGHKGKWKALAAAVNERYPQYNIKRVSSNAEKGISAPKQSVGYKYVLVCDGCGCRIYRKKASKAVTHAYRYRCAECGGKLKAFALTGDGKENAR